MRPLVGPSTAETRMYSGSPAVQVPCPERSDDWGLWRVVFRRREFGAGEADIAPVSLIEGSSASPPATCSTAPLARSRPPHSGDAAERAVERDVLPVARDRRVVSVFDLLLCGEPDTALSEASEIGPNTSAPAGAEIASNVIAGATQPSSASEPPHRTLTSRLTTPVLPSLSRTWTTTRYTPLRA